MTQNELEITIRGVRGMTFFAREIRDELDETIACALCGMSEGKDIEDLHDHLRLLVSGFVGSFECIRQETNENK